MASFENLPFQNKFHYLHFNSATPAHQIRSLNQIAFHFKQNTHQFLPSQTHVSLSLSLNFGSVHCSFLSLSFGPSPSLSLSNFKVLIFFFFYLGLSLSLSKPCLLNSPFLSLSKLWSLSLKLRGCLSYFWLFIYIFLCVSVFRRVFGFVWGSESDVGTMVVISYTPLHNTTLFVCLYLQSSKRPVTLGPIIID